MGKWYQKQGYYDDAYVIDTNKFTIVENGIRKEKKLKTVNPNIINEIISNKKDSNKLFDNINSSISNINSSISNINVSINGINSSVNDISTKIDNYIRSNNGIIFDLSTKIDASINDINSSINDISTPE